MPDNILESYFVRVAALPDASSFSKLTRTLKTTSSEVDNFSLRTVKNLLSIETAAIGVIGAIGIGMISLADKTAMTDQSYRLFGLRMLMNKQAARAMQMALDQLGATIDQVAYDPELNQRFQYLYEQNIKLGAQLGSNFDKNMRGIRDLRTEYKKFTTEFEFLVMGTISKLYDRLGFGNGSLLTMFKNFNDEFISKIPYYADQLSTYLIPIWNNFLTVSKDVGTVSKEVALDFTNLIGELSGDRSIIDSTLKFENLAKAIDHVASGATTAATGMTSFIGQASNTYGYLYHTVKSGNYESEAERQYFLARNSPPGTDIRPFIEEAHRNMKLAESEHSLALDLENEIRNGVSNNPNLVGQDALDYLKKQQLSEKGHNFRLAKNFGEIASTVGESAFSKYLDEAGTLYPNVDRNLISSLIWDESHGNPRAEGPLLPSGQRAKGLGQFLPGTAKDMGITDVFNPEQNIVGTAKYLSQLLKQYKDIPTALAYYGGYGGNVEKAHDYINNILSQRNSLLGSGLTIENFNVVLPPGTSKEHAEQIRDELGKLLGKTAGRVMAQVAAGAYH